MNIEDETTTHRFFLSYLESGPEPGQSFSYVTPFETGTRRRNRGGKVVSLRVTLFSAIWCAFCFFITWSP